jgi:hypothetical protein
MKIGVQYYTERRIFNNIKSLQDYCLGKDIKHLYIAFDI